VPFRNADVILTIGSIVGLKAHEEIPFDMEIFPTSFAIEFKRMLDEEPVHCARRNVDIAGLQRPSALIIDVCFL
jgi:hypothetical protein